MALTEEEKQKIIEEETLRAKVKEELNPKQVHTNGIISVVLGVVSFFLGIFGIVLAPAGMYLGFKSKKIEKSPWAWPGIIVNALFIVYIAVITLIGVASVNFVGDVQNEDNQYRTSTYKIEQKDNAYNSYDSIGRPILNLSGADSATQLNVWNADSEFKDDFIRLLPDFAEMKNFVKERIKGDALTTKLLEKISEVEEKYFAGTLDIASVKQSLKSLK